LNKRGQYHPPKFIKKNIEKIKNWREGDIKPNLSKNPKYRDD
jgi:hypothetical protein